MTVISVKCGDVIKRNHIFGPYIDIVHKKKLHRWIPEIKLNQKSENQKPDLEVKSENYRYHWILRLKLPIKLVSRDFYVVFLMMTSCDLTVTLTCTYFKHNTLLDFSPAVKKRFGRVWALYC